MDARNDRINGLGAGTLLAVALRSFFLQGSFSAQHRQGVGFAFCLQPVLRKLWPGHDDYHRSLVRHSENYNGNPFMGTLVLGAVANMERRLRDGDGITEEDIRRFKMIIGPATGSAGDRLFWGTLRPAALLAGIVGELAFGLWGAVVFLAAYNLPVWYLKVRWLFAGYHLGPKVVIEIRNEIIDRAVRTLGIAGAVLAGFATAALVAVFELAEITPGIALAGAAVVFFVTVWQLRRNVPLHLAFLVASVTAVLAGVISRFVF